MNCQWNVYVVVIIVCMGVVKAGDARCRCVCPKLKTLNELNDSLIVNDIDYTKKSVYIKNNVQPPCICESVVNQTLPREITYNIEDIGQFCLKCQCQFEQRNSNTQKVVIIFVIVIFGLMVIYGTFLVCLDPIMNKRRSTYRHQVDEITAEEIPADQVSPSTSSGRVSQVVSRVRQKQEKWKGEVTEQRKNIYTRHKMLN